MPDLSLATTLADRPTARFGIVGLPVPDSSVRRRVTRAAALTTILISTVYLVWRAMATIDPIAWPIAVLLLALEIHQSIGIVLFTHSLWNIDSRPPVARSATTDLRVALLIPTYNEAADTLFPVIAAARRTRLVSETWVLDDGDRPAIRDLCAKLGVRYLARPTHEHAKAGNLNFWLGREGHRFDLMAVIDADHVPSPALIEATVGYFDDPGLAIVQTPQEFYNTSFEYDDPDVFGEQKIFYRVIQPGKNRVGAAFWCGTGAVLRISAIRAVGGVDTKTLTEDIATSIVLHAAGWRSVYHNEVLAVGLAATDAKTYIAQRMRWGTGAMQVIRKSNPWLMRGLTLGQRIAYTTTLFGWFDAWRSAGYLTVPLLVVALGVVPIRAPLFLFLTLWGSVFVMQQASMILLSRGCYKPRMTLMFEAARMEAGMRATMSLIFPSRRPFVVADKGGALTRDAVPPPTLLIGYLLGAALGLVWFVASLRGFTPVHYSELVATSVAVLWLAINVLVVGATVLRIRHGRFRPERRRAVRFVYIAPAMLDGRAVTISDLSVSGARIVTSDHGPTVATFEMSAADGRLVRLLVREAGRSARADGSTEIRLQFSAGQEEERAAIASLLFDQENERVGMRRDLVAAA